MALREFPPCNRQHEWGSPSHPQRKRVLLCCFCLLLLEFSNGPLTNAAGLDSLIAQGAPPSSTVSNKKIEAKQIPVNPITVKPIEVKAIPAKQIPVNPITIKPIEAKPIPIKPIPVNPIQVAPIQPKPVSSKPLEYKPVELKMAQEDLRITDDVELAIDQAQAYPNSPEAQFLLAVSYSRTPYLERALKSIQKTKKLIKTSPEGYQTLDTLLNNYEDLLHHPDVDGPSDRPKKSLIQYRLAFGYYFKGYAIEKGYLKNAHEAPDIYYLKAEAAMREVIRLDPTDIWARNYLGFFLLERSTPSSSAKNNPGLPITATTSTSSNPALSQAMALWEESLKVNPVNPGASFLLGEAYLKQGNLKKALVYMNQSVDIPSEAPQPLKEEKAFQSRPQIPALQISPDSTTLNPR